MQVRTNRSAARFLLALLAATGTAASAHAQAITQAFTYQGTVADAGSPVNGTIDIQFSLFDAQTAGTQLGTPQVALGVNAVNGQFAFMLNTANEFGTAAFNGQQRWLEIAIRPSGSSDPFTVVDPRQPLTATPFASFAANAGTLNGQNATYYTNAANLTGTLSDARLSTNVARLNGTSPQVFTGAVQMTNSSNVLSGIGSQITELNANFISSGTLSTSHLPASVAFRGSANTFSAANTFTNAFNSFTGVGTGLTGLNASNLSSGTIPDARLSTNVALLSAANTFGNPSNSFSGSGAGLTALNASNIATGTLPDARLSANVPLESAANTFTGVNTFSNASNSFSGIGTGLINLNASNLVTGFVADARMSTNVPLKSSANVFTQPNSFASIGAGLGSNPVEKPLHVSTEARIGFLATPHMDLSTNTINAFSANNTPAALNLNSQVNGEVFLAMNGTAHVRVLQVHGADLAEKFPFTGEKPQPGMVVMIDADNPGTLEIAHGEYNTHVAGIVSGANGLPAGTILGNLPNSEDHPAIALSGRVWVYADASNGPIKAGDKLTTSATPGHAMKATDRDRSDGSVIGKAMTELPEGRGMVLVLVNLK
jgi:hypothetical protein